MAFQTQKPEVMKTTPSGVVVVAGCIMSQQDSGVPQGQICSDNYTYCHTEAEAADLTFYLMYSILTHKAK